MMSYVVHECKSQNVWFVHEEADRWDKRSVMVKECEGFTKEDAQAIARALNQRVAEKNLSAAIHELDKARDEYFATLGQINPDHVPF